MAETAYGYVDNFSLRLKSANVSPVGDCGGVHMNEETTARCLKFEAIFLWVDRVWLNRNLDMRLKGSFLISFMEAR